MWTMLRVFWVVYGATILLVLALALVIGLTPKSNHLLTTSNEDDEGGSESPSADPDNDDDDDDTAETPVTILGHTSCALSCSESGHDDPNLETNCAARCAPVACTGVGASTCRIICPTDQVLSESCPACEIVCDESAMCERTNCAWDCTAPSYTDEQVPPEVCALSCEAPACEYSDDSGWTTTGITAEEAGV